MWCYLEMADQRVSIRVWALSSRGSAEWRKLCLDFSEIFGWILLIDRMQRVVFSFVFLKLG